MQTIENVRSQSAHEPGAADFATPLPAGLGQPTHFLDTQDALLIHQKVMGYWYESVDYFRDNRIEQLLDYDFYDHIQWSDEDRQVLAARHQAPLTYNKIKMALDWIIGTERRTRIDGVVHPRAADDVDLAQVKSELLKYVSDTNRVPWARSAAFKDAAIVGVGWTTETIRTDRAGEPVSVEWVPWQQMRRDPFDRTLDLADSRYVTREKFLDLDYAEAMFPDRVDLLRRSARDYWDGDSLGIDEEMDLPQCFRRYDSRGHEVNGRRIVGHVTLGKQSRMRVRVIEVWFRKPVTRQRLWGGQFAGEVLDPTNPAHVSAVEQMQEGASPYSVSNSVQTEIWSAMATEEGLLQLRKSPFRHGKFPFTPYWCYRRSRDGMEYGVVRGVRDSQEDLNKRMSKLLWALSTNQLLYEDGAIDEDQEASIKQELAKPNGVIKVAAGALSGQRIRIERNFDVAEAQIRLLELDAAHIHDGSGVNRELLGRDTNAASGRAILAKQQEGAVTTAELFDNYRLGIQLSGEKQLSLMEQFMTEERQFRIVGERKGVDWRVINQLRLDTLNNVWVVDNDISRSQADFVVDQQDFRETMRQAYAEQFMDMLGKLPPDMAIQLLDLAFDMADIPGKDEVVRRIRKMNGQSEDGDPNDPQALAQQQAAAQDRQLQMRERMAKVGLDEAKANEIMAKAQKTKLGAKADALDLAQLIEILLPLAPAADRLLSTEQPQVPQEETADVQ